MDLFEYQADKDSGNTKPLADRMRPTDIGEFIGQENAVGDGSLIANAIGNDRIFSMILWGPPGSGKTTLARILAARTRCHFVSFSAVLSGVKDIRQVIEIAKEQKTIHRKRTILFVDEIHRFSKSQQDAFLHHVESGLITLIGATTENPSFEVIPALLSRCRVITLNPLSEEHLAVILKRALADRERGLGKMALGIEEEALSHIIHTSDGDARSALNSLEVAAMLAAEEKERPEKTIAGTHVKKAIQKKALLYDKSGEEHYNLISAFHKSLRGSDPDGAVYWFVRMMEAGEDPLYIARRMVRFASEDIGNADPRAITVAMDAMAAYRVIGSPEGDLNLAQAAIYLATAPKSNRVYAAYNKARDLVRQTGTLPVPMHIRNAPTRLMKDLDYGKGYKYAHDYEDAYIPQDYLPEKLKGQAFYSPTERGYEKIISQRMAYWESLKKQKGKNSSSREE
ncbi:MAG: replication-associated recombination protein A [Desulfosalsimonadaceae bacterium]